MEDSSSSSKPTYLFKVTCYTDDVSHFGFVPYTTTSELFCGILFLRHKYTQVTYPLDGVLDEMEAVRKNYEAIKEKEYTTPETDLLISGMFGLVEILLWPKLVENSFLVPDHVKVYSLDDTVIMGEK
tara:strand:- start:824 stop:1204 length:381 start_codon:yes stop_codon:yes gene_type:complete